MFGLSFAEVLLLSIIALIVIGPRQLPEFARQVGRIVNEIKRAAGDFTNEIKSQVDINLDLDKATPPAADEEYSKHIAVEAPAEAPTEIPGAVPPSNDDDNKKDEPT